MVFLAKAKALFLELMFSLKLFWLLLMLSPSLYRGWKIARRRKREQMIESLMKALAAGLSIWESKEKRKYQDEYLSIKNDWYAEYSKPENARDGAVLDRLELRLRNLVDSFSASVGASNPSPGA